MTESNRSLSEVPALIAERKRYESWLEALDARRETTPVHVFERVQADYRARVDRVAEQIASYRQAIEEERTNVDSRLSLLEAEERMRRDERAELELRAHVGELAGEDAVAAFNVVDEAVALLVSEKAGLQTRIAELDALLDSPESPPVVAPPSALPSTVRASQATPVPQEEELLREEEPQREEAPQRASAELSALADLGEPIVVSEEPAPVADVAPAPNAPRQSRPSAAVDEARVSVQRGAVAVATPPEPSPAVQSEAPVSAPPRVSELRTPSGTFDELKFLNTVVGRGTLAGNIPASSPSPALAQGSTPARHVITGEQTKTLKCSECGAQNYPTEWYCERCGGELAAL